jgi:hypothetical protein
LQSPAPAARPCAGNSFCLRMARKAMDQKQRRAIRAQTNDIQDRLNEHGPGRPGGPLGWAPARKGRPTGNSSAAIIRRLRRDHPELHQLVLAGELTPYRAAVIAGFRRQRRKPTSTLDGSLRSWRDGAASPGGLSVSSFGGSISVSSRGEAGVRAPNTAKKSSSKHFSFTASGHDSTIAAAQSLPWPVCNRV